MYCIRLFVPKLSATLAEAKFSMRIILVSHVQIKSQNKISLDVIRRARDVSWKRFNV